MEMCSDPVPDAAVGAEIEARKDGISQAMPAQTKLPSEHPLTLEIPTPRLVFGLGS